MLARQLGKMCVPRLAFPSCDMLSPVLAWPVVRELSLRMDEQARCC